MTDAIRATSRNAPTLAAYGCRQFCMTTPPYPPAVSTEWSRRRAMMSATSRNAPFFEMKIYGMFENMPYLPLFRLSDGVLWYWRANIRPKQKNALTRLLCRSRLLSATWSPFLITSATISAWRSYRAVCARRRRWYMLAVIDVGCRPPPPGTRRFF